MHGRLLLEDDGRHSATLAESTHPGTDRARRRADAAGARRGVGGAAQLHLSACGEHGGESRSAAGSRAVAAAAEGKVHLVEFLLERVQVAAARAGERAPPRNRGAGRWEAGVGAPATRYPVRASGPTVRARRPGVGTRSRRTGVTESSPPTCVPSLEPCRHLLTTELLRRPCAGARFCSARDRPNAVEGGLLAHDSRARAACDCRVQSARRCAASKIGVGSTALSWVEEVVRKSCC